MISSRMFGIGRGLWGCAPRRRPRAPHLFLSGIILLIGLCQATAHAQQLDNDVRPYFKPGAGTKTLERYVPQGAQPKNAHSAPTANNVASPASAPPLDAGLSMAKPLTATVTHTLYLPPAMYGQWNVTGTLIQTNAPDLFSPTVNDIWILERSGNQVTVTNPVNGATAAISVDKAEGNQATFHRSGTAGKHSIYQESPTLTVEGDLFTGQSVNKLQNIKDGRVVDEVYGIYRLEGNRISAARTRFRPEAELQKPDFQIEEVRP